MTASLAHNCSIVSKATASGSSDGDTPPIEVRLTESIVYVTPTTIATDDQYRAYLREMTRVMHDEFHGFRRSVIFDGRTAVASTAAQRKLQAQWLGQSAELLKRTTAGIGFVFDHPVIRGAMKAVFWLQPSPVPFRVFSTLGDAQDWAERQFAQSRDMQRRS